MDDLKTLSKLPKWPKMVYVIKDTKVDMKQHWDTSFFETNREVLAFFFQNCGKFLQLKTPTPWAREAGRNPDPPFDENVRIPGIARGGWSGLELTAT